MNFPGLQAAGQKPRKCKELAVDFQMAANLV